MADTDPPSMLVTGAARGLGAAIAVHAARHGYRVAAVDLDVPSGHIDAEGVSVFKASVTDQAAIDGVLDQFGTPDVVVNNAGIVRFGPLVDQAVDDFRAVLDVNLVGAFVVATAVARRLMAEQRPGSIVNITSMNGVAAGPNAGAYGASKAGVAMLTSQMALEWGGRGIRVNAVAPGLIDAGMSEPIYADPATRTARESKVPIGRLGTAADIAEVVTLPRLRRRLLCPRSEHRGRRRRDRLGHRPPAPPDIGRFGGSADARVAREIARRHVRAGHRRGFGHR